MLSPNTFYHIYNHANGDDNLFREDKNYRYFLALFQKHISPIANTFAYCLMPNHFHFLLKIKEVAVFQTFPKFETLENLENLENLETPENYLILQHYISKQFGNCFSAYTQGYNKAYDRRGSLFIKNFKSKAVDSDLYFTRLVNYIHFNPVAHGFVEGIEDWPYSSYKAFLENSKTAIQKQQTLDTFGGIEKFLEAHQSPFKLEDAFD